MINRTFAPLQLETAVRALIKKIEGTRQEGES